MPMFGNSQQPAGGSAFGNIDPNMLMALLKQRQQQQQAQAMQAQGQPGAGVGAPQMPGSQVQNGGLHPMQGGQPGQFPQMPTAGAGIASALGTPANGQQNQGLLAQLQALMGLKNSGLNSGMPSGQGQ